MKKFINIIVIILLSVTLLPAQDLNQNLPQQKQKKNKVSGGLYLKGGVSWMMSDSREYINRDNSGKAKLSYGFGAIMDLNLTNNFSLNIAAGFSNVGGTVNFKNGVESFTDRDGTLIGGPQMHNYKYATSYIEVPIGIKGCTNEIGYFTYFLKLGVDPMVRIKTNVTLETKERRVVERFNLVNVAWFVGGGAEWSLVGNTRLLFELVYTGSFLDFDNRKILAYKDDNSTFNPSIKFHDISLRVGVIF